MKRSYRQYSTKLLPLLVIIVFLLSTANICAGPGPITGSTAIKSLGPLKKSYIVPNFAVGGTYEFGNEASYEFGGAGGVTLESLGAGPLRVSYIAVGTPERDKDGNIVNAVIVSSYYSGDSSNSYFAWYEGEKGNPVPEGPVVGPGQLIDTDKYYVIFLDALGLWGASKPSDGPGLKFPQYSLMDCVQANYRLLKDELKVAKIKLATGVSMGGAQSYVLATLHPDYVEAIMPIGALSAANPVTRWLFRLMTAAMQSDPVWQKTKGDYYGLPKEQHPNQGMMFGWSILGHTSLSLDFRAKQKWDVVKKEVFSWTPEGDEGAGLVSQAQQYDVIDLLYRNHTLDVFDIDDQLGRIKAKTLVLHVKNDQWLMYSVAEATAGKIKDAQIVGFEHPLAHYAIFRAPNICKDAVMTFLRSIGMK